MVQFHLAGHTNLGTHCIDTHDGAVVDPVWELYRLAHQLTSGASTLLEWDADIPEFDVLHDEVLKARNYMQAKLPSQDEAASPRQLPSSPPARDVADRAVVPHPVSFIVPDLT